MCDSCIEENEDDEGEGEFKRIIEDKKIDNDILMCPDVPPLANRIDSYSESLIARINGKILRLKDLMVDTASVNYTNKKNYCLRYKNLLEMEQRYVQEEDEMKEFFKYELKFSDDSQYKPVSQNKRVPISDKCIDRRQAVIVRLPCRRGIGGYCIIIVDHGIKRHLKGDLHFLLIPCHHAKGRS